MPTIFISHSTQDNPLAQEICAFLKDNHFEYWIDLEQLQDISKSWPTEITKALNDADLVMVLVSPAASASRWVEEEIRHAQDRNKKIIVVLIDGQDLVRPFGLARLGFIDLRGTKLQSDKSKLLSGIQTALVSPLLPPDAEADQPPPSKSSDHNPFHVSQMILADIVLGKVLAEIRPNSKLAWRASLLWFYADHWYVAAQNGNYLDDERRLWFERGQGFAGKVWAENDQTIPYSIYEPSKKSVSKLRNELNLDQVQAELTRKMRTIICYPIIHLEQKRMLGMISVDYPVPNPPQSSPRYADLSAKTLDSVTFYLSSLANFPDYTAMHYPSYMGLRHLLRTSRLLPPLEKPARAAIYWKHTHKDDLYMIASSEREKTEWTTQSITFNTAELEQTHLVSRAWQKSRLQYETIPSPDDPNKKITGVALPIQGEGRKALGVLTLEWDDEMKVTDDIGSIETLRKLAELAAKVLEKRTSAWDDGVG